MIYDETFNREFYESLGMFKMQLKMKLASGANGGRKSNAKGSSVEFSDFREYIPGDDVRRIDWNAYARFDRLFVKLFMEEKEGIFRIYLDAGASMDYGEANKAVAAKRLAAAMSYCILDNSDRVILSVLKDGKCESFKGVTGKQGFSKIIDNLTTVRFEGRNDLLASIRSRDLTTRGVAIVISDFYTDKTEDIIKYLVLKKQEVVLVQVLSPEELDPELLGTYDLIDSEDGSLVKVTSSAQLIRNYKSTLNGFIENTKALCKKYSAAYYFANSSENITAVLRGRT